MNDRQEKQSNHSKTNKFHLRDSTWKLPVAYSIIVTFLALATLIYLLNLIEQRHNMDTKYIPLTLLVALVLSGGVIGGSLFNMHSLVTHIDRGDFNPNHNVSYYICPISGAVCGLVVVILLLGGVLTLGLGKEAEVAVIEHPGKLMPFIAVAIVAGYGSRQFKKKLDEIADTIFRTDNDKDDRIKAGRKGTQED